MDPLDDLLTQLADVDEEELVPLDSINAKSSSVEEKSKKKCGPNLVEVDICASSENWTKEKENKNKNKNKNEENGRVVEDDSDDDEHVVRRRHLNTHEQTIERHLKENSSTSGPTATNAWKSNKKTILTGVAKSAQSIENSNVSVNFDKFGLAVRNPKVSSHNFGTFTAGMKCVKLGDIKPTSTFKDSWCTMGVLVEKGLTKKSANGNEYLIWRFHDLKDCQAPTSKLLLFGDAVKEHWKIAIGSVIALMSAQIADESNQANGPGGKSSKPTAVTLKAPKATNIVEIGVSPHFGFCKGTRQQDGHKCSNFVNTALSEYCVYHVMSAARKLSANRGSFNAVTCGPNIGGLSIPKKKVATPKNLIVAGRPIGGGVANAGSPRVAAPLPATMRPAASNSFAVSTAKTTTKAEEKSTLDEIISSRKNTFAARAMLKIKEQKDEKRANLNEVLDEFGATVTVKKTKKEEKPATFAEFVQREDAREKASTIDLSSSSEGTSRSGMSKMWPSSMTTAKMPMGAKDAQEHAARLRAVALLKKKREEVKTGGGLKRKAVEDFDDNSKKFKSESPSSSSKGSRMDEIKQLLSRKSLHQGEVEQVVNDRLQKHLSSMEERERVETFTTTCMAIKNIRVISCKICKYTSQTQSSYCIEQKHEVHRHDAEKRFFKCSGCKKRTVCFELMPVKACAHCNETKWIRVAMRDERKVQLETENLLLRGEERTFVMS